MGNIAFLFLLASNSFAKPMVFTKSLTKSLTTEQQLSIATYKENRTVLMNCLVGEPTPNKKQSCTETLPYFEKYCNKKKSTLFQRYMDGPRYFNDACDLLAEAENHLENFFAVDEQSCRRGFESMADRLLSLKKYEKYFLEQDSYMFEKNTCKDMQRYKLLCRYIDGELGNLVPSNKTFLPNIDYQKNEKTCEKSVMIDDPLATMEKDLRSANKGPGVNAYQILVQNYRSRGARPESFDFPICTGIRNIYMNFNCAEFEKVPAGKPNYLSDDEIKQKKNSSQSKTAS